jgi:hypothetical protein
MDVSQKDGRALTGAGLAVRALKSLVCVRQQVEEPCREGLVQNRDLAVMTNGAADSKDGTRAALGARHSR